MKIIGTIILIYLVTMFFLISLIYHKMENTAQRIGFYMLATAIVLGAAGWAIIIKTI